MWKNGNHEYVTTIAGYSSKKEKKRLINGQYSLGFYFYSMDMRDLDELLLIQRSMNAPRAHIRSLDSFLCPVNEVPKHEEAPCLKHQGKHTCSHSWG